MSAVRCVYCNRTLSRSEMKSGECPSCGFSFVKKQQELRFAFELNATEQDDMLSVVQAKKTDERRKAQDDSQNGTAEAKIEDVTRLRQSFLECTQKWQNAIETYNKVEQKCKDTVSRDPNGIHSVCEETKNQMQSIVSRANKNKSEFERVLVVIDDMVHSNQSSEVAIAMHLLEFGVLDDQIDSINADADKISKLNKEMNRRIRQKQDEVQNAARERAERDRREAERRRQEQELRERRGRCLGICQLMFIIAFVFGVASAFLGWGPAYFIAEIAIAAIGIILCVLFSKWKWVTDFEVVSWILGILAGIICWIPTLSEVPALSFLRADAVRLVIWLLLESSLLVFIMSISDDEYFVWAAVLGMSLVIFAFPFGSTISDYAYSRIKYSPIYSIHNFSYTYSDGYVYQGEWRDGNTREGFGKLISPDGYSYEGEWKNDEYNGYGKQVWASGAYYEGEFLNGYRNGHGKYVYPDGTILEGRYENGEFISE